MMKRYVLLLINLCLWASLLNAQSTNQNYIRTRTYLDASQANSLDQISYFDGLGRPVQVVQRKITPGGADLVTHQEYDNFGRQSNVWNPVYTATTNDGKLVSLATVKSRSVTSYGDANAYTIPEYESSPLNRITSQTGPGKLWHQNKKAVKTEYLTNTLEGELACKLFITTDDRQINSISLKSQTNSLTTTVSGKTVNLTSGGKILVSPENNYKPGELYVTKVTDEEGNISYEFKDKLGQVVLTRQINNKDMLDTYYIYDSYGNLRAVLPPLAADLMTTTVGSNEITTVLNQYAYLYKYDTRNRMVEKRLPGCNPVRFIYDKADRMVFSQDGEQAIKKEWTFYLYDALGRLVVQGTCTNTNTFNAAEIIVTTSFAPWEGSNSHCYFTNFYIESPTVHTVNYYDNYDFLIVNGFNNSNFSIGKISAKGLLTGTVTAILGDTTKLYSVNHYDLKGNLTLSVSSNHLGGYDKINTTYNFTNNPVVVKHVHTAMINNKLQTDSLVYNYEYDKQTGRLSFVKHRYNKGDIVILAENKYDELGRLKNVVRGKNTKLTDTYNYNVRSWMTRISNGLFADSLNYRLNGNISSMEWEVDKTKRSYTFAYDSISRLKSASYKGIGSENYKTSYNYDKHGNIKKLMRYGKTSATAYGVVDNLTMTYTGNQLIKVDETVPNVSLTESNDYKKNSTDAKGYSYNKNGAMTQDLNKKISSITYNSLNLPEKVVINNITHSYLYAADGRKLRVTQGSTNRDYSGNFIYENGSLKRILVEGGYIQAGTYYFYLNDHLGNVRVVADKDGKVIQRNQYYPFGLPMAETTSAQQDVQPYKYNSKEFDRKDGLNLFDYGARYMDPAIGRFTTMDPLAEKYYSVSPYAYCNNNPMRLVDPDGRGPIDRVQAAFNLLGIMYKQESKTSLRTEDTQEALEFVDCSEFVCRVLAADGITEEVEHMNTSKLSEIFNNEDKFIHSETPQLGDIAVWSGHVGVVTEVGNNDKVKISHATKPGQASKENPYAIAAKDYRPKATFYGYYRPKKETPDGKVKQKTNAPSAKPRFKNITHGSNTLNLIEVIGKSPSRLPTGRTPSEIPSRPKVDYIRKDVGRKQL